jgi:hypothetical protein
MKSILFLLLSFSFINKYNIGTQKEFNLSNKAVYNFFQHDTSAAKLKKFRAFSERFFNAIRSNDTTFLKAHVLFPIVNSSFTNMDSTIKESRGVNRQYFLSHIQKLFPNELISRIDKEGEFDISAPKKGQTEYSISLYDKGEIEYDFTWSFIEKHDRFFFIRFRAEPG